MHGGIERHAKGNGRERRERLYSGKNCESLCGTNFTQGT
jgi:hypothetical protein